MRNNRLPEPVIRVKQPALARFSPDIAPLLFIDFCGPTVPVINPDTGEIRRVAIFVAVMGASNYTYVEACEGQDMMSWLNAHSRCLTFLGGVPKLLIPDNLRSAVKKADRYEPVINDSYQALAEHYGTVIIPARPRKPKDKPKAENGVLIVERWLLARIRNETFHTLRALNARLRELLTDMNNRPMKGYGNQTRAERFRILDAPALSPLPLAPYEYTEYKAVKVGPDYHVEYARHWYSVPHELVGQRLSLKAGQSVVQLWHKGQCVAQHPRSTHEYKHTTNPLHMPERHRQHGTWTPERLIEQFWGCWHFRKNTARNGWKRPVTLPCTITPLTDALSTICCVTIGRTWSFHYPARANNIRHMLQSMKTCVVRATATDRRNNSMSDNLLNKLTQLKLPAMAGSLIRQRETPQTYDELSFEERLTLLVDDELLSRENSRVARLRKNAGLKYQATPEGLRYPASRGLRAEQMRELLNGHYITHRKNLLITGPTGCGKSWIANALGEQACRQKHSVRYCRTGRLLEQLAQGRVDGSWLKYLKQLQKIQVLILDDLGLEQLSNAQCNDLLELIEDRYGQSSTIVVSQFPVDKWHGLMENPTTADAILDRLVHNSHRVVLQGESLRKNPPVVESSEKTR